MEIIKNIVLRTSYVFDFVTLAIDGVSHPIKVFAIPRYGFKKM